MRERKYVKFKVDMYEDTKSKLIDLKPERDLIHYLWSRVVVLAGKSDSEGDLYMSKNIPYTLNTLAVEFNRSVEQVKLALDIFIEFEMVEIVDGAIYRVKNFAKHQNIKVKEKTKVENNFIANKELNLEAENKVAIDERKNRNSENEINTINFVDKSNLEKSSKKEEQVEKSILSENIISELSNSLPITFETKNNRKSRNKKKNIGANKKDTIFEMEGDANYGEMISFSDGDMGPPGEGESIIFKMSL